MKKSHLLLASISLLTSYQLSSCNSSSNLTIVHFDQTILGSNQKELGVSIGIKKGNEELKSKINSSLSKINQETRNRWMLNATNRSNGNNVTDETEVSLTYDESKPNLTIGLECNYSPFNWTETSSNNYNYPINGQVNQFAAGYDITIAKFLADDLNMNLVIQKMEWEGLIPSLQNNTIDLVIAGMTDTDERRESIDFTDEYYRSELVLITRDNISYLEGQDINNVDLSKFSGAKFVSQVSTVTDSVIDSWVNQYNVIHLSAMKTFADCALAIRNGNADVMTAELPVAQSIVGA